MPKFVNLILLCAAMVSGQGKRGLAYGYHSPEDLAALSPEVSWWYNWAETPEASVADVYPGYGFEFVPMAWNGSFNQTKLRDFLSNHPDVKYLLAFNEPNFLAQANMTPSQAAAAWPALESIADDYQLEIVGPAVNFCGGCVTENGTTYTNPFDYLDDFFTACSGCRVDHIAVHCYMNTLSALRWYIGQFKKYGRPIWLTEFAGWESNGVIRSVDDQINYMRNAVGFLEADTTVFRYAWFIGRWDGISTYPHIDLLGANGTLTALGEAYKQMPVPAEIPAPAEAGDAVQVFPNPISGNMLTIRNAQDYSVAVFDIRGRRIISTRPAEHGKIDVSALKHGVYLLRISGNTFTTTKNIVKY